MSSPRLASCVVFYLRYSASTLCHQCKISFPHLETLIDGGPKQPGVSSPPPMYLCGRITSSTSSSPLHLCSCARPYMVCCISNGHVFRAFHGLFTVPTASIIRPELHMVWVRRWSSLSLSLSFTHVHGHPNRPRWNTYKHLVNASLPFPGQQTGVCIISRISFMSGIVLPVAVVHPPMALKEKK